MDWKASWIWDRREALPYNDAIVAERRIRVPDIHTASIAVTADSWYRLFINDVWVNDGPARSWPEKKSYDVIDITHYLSTGENEIRILARFYGCGTMKDVSVAPGILAQIDLTARDGSHMTVGTDGEWQTAPYTPLVTNAPKASVQMEAFEIVDARRVIPSSVPARVLYGACAGPYRELVVRDVALLTKEPKAIRRVHSLSVVRRPFASFTFPAARLCHPGVIECNFYTGIAHAVATVITSDTDRELSIDAPLYRIMVNGSEGVNGRYRVRKGKNLITAAIYGAPPYYNAFLHRKETSISFPGENALSFSNPVDSAHENPWVFIPFDESAHRFDDIEFGAYGRQRLPEREALLASYPDTVSRFFSNAADTNSLIANYGGAIKLIAHETMCLVNPAAAFQSRSVIGDARSLFVRSEAAIDTTPESTVIAPSTEGDVEIVYDLGAQHIGYYEFDVTAAAGTVIDIFGVEYIAANGIVQHTGDYLNGMRYICAEGRNRFTSLKRRSGRYLFLCVRDQRSPVTIHTVRLIASAYPVKRRERFVTSDERINRIWEISAHTLELCMEDTFTDCPLYEQVLWLGDARNEALFALAAFGASDIVKRSLRLGAQSLSRLPMVGCQVPSTWDCIIPAVSFSWNLSVREYYRWSKDDAFLREIYPAAIANIRAAERLTNENGLFEAPYWNFFDWTNIDFSHRIVLYNSLFAVAASDAVMECALALGKKEDIDFLKQYRLRLAKGINRLWNMKKRSYPDSIHDDGTVSASSCIHTSMLSVLFHVASKKILPQAIRNLLRPRAAQVKLGSPYALMFFFETLEMLQYEQKIIPSIIEKYSPMLSLDATTAWETFAGQFGWLPKDYPTRSHAHGWSSAPLYWFPRLILGIRETGEHNASFRISPRIDGLTSARGTLVTVHGGIRVSWKRENNTLTIDASAPHGLSLSFMGNTTTRRLTVLFNGRTVQRAGAGKNKNKKNEQRSRQ
ncbi:MAG: alpha-L-rhamnosidase N-terminal domain-containing protein [Spirochaetota bacterium]